MLPPECVAFVLRVPLLLLNLGGRGRRKKALWYLKDLVQEWLMFNSCHLLDASNTQCVDYLGVHKAAICRLGLSCTYIMISKTREFKVFVCCFLADALFFH